ncbi:MAG: nucleotidyl transferase AbiEii/AbiGii toxin family protein [Candidatus Berkelbacteria bacterium]
MDKQFYWDILDQKRINILPLFKVFKDDFYLAGGTALALQLGHRDSIDFDFFSEQSFSTEDLTKKVEQIFQNHQIAKIQEEKDTLTFIIDDTIKISFFAFPYKPINPLLDEDNFKMASLEDIGAMKLSAITSRSVLKDYVDLYFILHKISLEELFKLTKEKFPTIDVNLILKSLVYFDDILEEPILFKHDDDISFELVKKYLSETVTNYLAKVNK